MQGEAHNAITAKGLAGRTIMKYQLRFVKLSHRFVCCMAYMIDKENNTESGLGRDWRREMVALNLTCLTGRSRPHVTIE
jgi:hypothetical protein